MLKGIISGYPDGTFKPQNTANRAEASSMILRLINPSDRKPFDLRTESEKLDAHVTQKGDILSLNLPKKTMSSILPSYYEAHMKRGEYYTYKMFDDPSIFQMKYSRIDEMGYYRVWMKINAPEVYLLDKNFNIIGNGMGLYGELSEWGFDADSKDTKSPANPEAKYFAWYAGEDTVYIVPNTLSYK